MNKRTEMYRLGLVDMLVTHANTNRFGLTSLSGVCCASSVKNKTKGKTGKDKVLGGFCCIEDSGGSGMAVLPA